MKNYRLMKRYHPDEWEHDQEWKAARLDFLWDMRRYYVKDFFENTLQEEIGDFYHINNIEVSKIAHFKQYSIDFDTYDNKLKGYSEDEIKRQLDNLEELRMNNPDEFLLKKNCNLYEYLKDRLRL